LHLDAELEERVTRAVDELLDVGVRECPVLVEERRRGAAALRDVLVDEPAGDVELCGQDVRRVHVRLAPCPSPGDRRAPRDGARRPDRRPRRSHRPGPPSRVNTCRAACRTPAERSPWASRPSSPAQASRTYSKSTGWPLTPRAGGAIQLANLPRSVTGCIRLWTYASSSGLGSHSRFFTPHSASVSNRPSGDTRTSANVPILRWKARCASV